MPKKKWERPKLIVLLKGKPGERVLAFCKSGGGLGPGTGPGNTWFACSTVTPCPTCDSILDTVS